MTEIAGEIKVENLGLVPFKNTWEYQTQLHSKIVEAKRAEFETYGLNHLLLCSHRHVYTLGKSGKENHLKLQKSELEEKGIEFYKINRGGDITYHGPGQMVAYPIMDLELIGRDVHRYIRTLEQIVINTLSKWHIKAERLEKYTGVWVQHNHGWKKICAIGVHLSRWVSMHGIALNVNTDLMKFDHIIPCGIQDGDKDVCSMSSLLNEQIPMNEVCEVFTGNFLSAFKLKRID